jgi:hypothetical protein
MCNTPDAPAKKPDDRMNQGGNYWTLFTPGIWKVLHAVFHKLCAVAGLAPGQVEVERVAVEISLEVDFGRETAARAAKRLVLLPPFAPAAETCARAVVLSKSWTKCAVWLHSASSWKNASNTPERLSRQNRFHTLFQLPNSLGSARQLMLCTVK